jgi:hypothetical protein
MKRALLLLLLLAPARIHADPCRAHCRDVARACKDRCHLQYENPFEPKRHKCEQVCKLHEDECRSRC